MNTAEIIKKYGTYYDYLQKLGKMLMCDTPTIKNLNPKSGVIQAVYNDIEKYKFKGTFIDYLCWIGSLFLINVTIGISGRKASTIFLKQSFLPELYLKSDIRNFYRLAHRKPEIILELLGLELKYENYRELAKGWFKIYLDDLETYKNRQPSLESSD
jgi:hypothetical protein